MKQRLKRFMGILLTLAIVVGMMPGMGLTVRADEWEGNPYKSLVNSATTVKFNGYDWYIIKDESKGLKEGTVTLLAKDPIGKSKFSNSSNNKYSESDVNTYLGNLTKEGGDFAGVADAIETISSLETRSYNNSNVYDTVSNAKLYLLSKGEADGLPENVKKCSTSNGNCWWLRSPGDLDAYAACVDGEDGSVDGGGACQLGVR